MGPKAGELDGRWWIGFALAALPILPWPFFAFLAILDPSSKGAYDNDSLSYITAASSIGLQVMYPLLFLLMWCGVRMLRRQGRTRAAVTLLLALPALSVTTLLIAFAAR